MLLPTPLQHLVNWPRAGRHAGVDVGAVTPPLGLAHCQRCFGWRLHAAGAGHSVTAVSAASAPLFAKFQYLSRRQPAYGDGAALAMRGSETWRTPACGLLRQWLPYTLSSPRRKGQYRNELQKTLLGRLLALGSSSCSAPRKPTRAIGIEQQREVIWRLTEALGEAVRTAKSIINRGSRSSQPGHAARDDGSGRPPR